jgi:hypothetical protein
MGGVLDLALVALTSDGLTSSAGLVTAQNNTGTGGNSYNKDTVLGTAAHLRLSSANSAVFYGDAGDSISTPDSVASRVSGSFILGAYVRPDDNSIGELTAICGKYTTTGNKRSYMLVQDNSPQGGLALYLSADGTNFDQLESSEVLPYADGVRFWIFTFYDAVARTVRFYTSTASPQLSYEAAFATATELGEAQSTSISSIFQDSGTKFEIGSFNGGQLGNFSGSIYKATVINGTDITVTGVDFNANEYVNGREFRSLSGTELVVNGTFTSGIGSWLASDATLSYTGDALRVTTPLAARGAYQSFTTIVGYRYKATAQSLETSAESMLRVGNGATPDAGIATTTATSVPTIHTISFTATGTTSYIYLRNPDPGVTVWDNVGVEELSLFTLAANTFINPTAYDRAKSIGSAGLETSSGVAIDTVTTEAIIVQVDAVTGSRQVISGSRATTGHTLGINAAGNFFYDNGNEVSLGAATVGLKLIIIRDNLNGTSVGEVVGLTAVTSDFGSDNYDYGASYANVSNGDTFSGAISAHYVWNYALIDTEIAAVKTELTILYGL